MAFILNFTIAQGGEKGDKAAAVPLLLTHIIPYQVHVVVIHTYKK